MSTKNLPRNPDLPAPPREKPPRGYDPIPREELEERLSNAAKEDLILLLVKGWNAGAFTIYEKSAGGRADAAGGDSSAGSEDENGDDPPYETDEINGWPPV